MMRLARLFALYFTAAMAATIVTIRSGSMWDGLVALLMVFAADKYFAAQLLNLTTLHSAAEQRIAELETENARLRALVSAPSAGNEDEGIGGEEDERIPRVEVP